jgi:hypothetical protein
VGPDLPYAANRAGDQGPALPKREEEQGHATVICNKRTLKLC